MVIAMLQSFLAGLVTCVQPLTTLPRPPHHGLIIILRLATGLERFESLEQKIEIYKSGSSADLDKLLGSITAVESLNVLRAQWVVPLREVSLRP